MKKSSARRRNLRPDEEIFGQQKTKMDQSPSNHSEKNRFSGISGVRSAFFMHRCALCLLAAMRLSAVTGRSGRSTDVTGFDLSDSDNDHDSDKQSSLGLDLSSDDEPPPATAAAAPPRWTNESTRGASSAGGHSGTPLSRVAPCTGSSSTSSNDGRGKYPRSADKGAHPTWAQKCAVHLGHLSNSTWIQARPCDASCRFTQSCWKRINENDIRDCALHMFGHVDPATPPQTTHKQATEKWWDLVYGARQIADNSQTVTGVAFRIVHGSGIEVCSAAACWCYCAPNSTWSLMIKACKSGRTVWTEAVSTELGAIARKWQQTKVNDSVRNDPAMHALSQH